MLGDNIEQTVILYLRKRDIYRPNKEVREIINICRTEPLNTAVKILIFDYRIGNTRQREVGYIKTLTKIINNYDRTYKAASERIDSIIGG